MHGITCMIHITWLWHWLLAKLFCFISCEKKCRSLRPWGPGFRVSISPQVSFTWMHHFPGTTLRSFSSISCNCGSSSLKGVAKIAGVGINSDMLIFLKEWLSNVVFWNSGVLQRRVWKYDWSGKTTLLKYISSFLGRLSHPFTQCSKNPRVRTIHDEPARADTLI